MSFCNRIWQSLNGEMTDRQIVSQWYKDLRLICKYILVYQQGVGGNQLTNFYCKGIFIGEQQTVEQQASLLSRQIDRKIDRYIYRQIDRQIDIQINRQIDRYVDRKIYRQIDRQIDRQKDRQIDRQIDRLKTQCRWI